MEEIYATLMLHKLGKEINEASLKSVLKAAGADVEDFQIKSLVASLKGVDIEKELESATLAVAAAPASAVAAVAKEEPKEEKSNEAAAEGLSALFG